MSSLDLSGNSLDATGQPVSAQERARLFGLMLGFAGMVLGQFMAFLDIQIINSSLAQIQSGVSASSDEISWVQSAYLISEVVMIPLSSYLARWWGTQRLFMISCAGFTIMSVLTGLCTTIDAMIVTRALRVFNRPTELALAVFHKCAAGSVGPVSRWPLRRAGPAQPRFSAQF